MGAGLALLVLPPLVGSEPTTIAVAPKGVWLKACW
jgi:hypothetical protein